MWTFVCVKVRMLLTELEEARGTVVRMPQEDDSMDVSSSSGIITGQLVTFKWEFSVYVIS